MVLHKVQLLENDHHENERIEAAARKLQAAWRIQKGRRMLKRLVRRDWKKRVDPTSGALFYYNTRTGSSKWEKPFCLGPGDDLPEPPYHCVLQARPGGPVVYFNRATNVRSEDKPLGMQLCWNCQTFYPTVRCVYNPLAEPHPGEAASATWARRPTGGTECRGRAFCDDCHKAYHVLSKEDHPKESVAVRPAVCKICNDPGNICCYDCVGDVFCERCSGNIHSALEQQGISHDDWTYVDFPD